mgnify:FL=1|jgi:hypothetical protein|tara:strand:- start:5126 stop:5617 length:492 start_codon:yes stop_codon:yes gene_type:complete
MKKVYKTFPYEFLFLINGNPIVGRNFPIYNFNKDSFNSIELKELVDDCVDILKLHFKNKTYDYMYKYYNPYFYSTAEENVSTDVEVKDIYEEEDFFTFQILHNKKIVVEKIFTGNDYPPQVRYDVDIRKILPKIIDQVQQGLNQKNYTKEYGNYELDRIFIKK